MHLCNSLSYYVLLPVPSGTSSSTIYDGCIGDIVVGNETDGKASTNLTIWHQNGRNMRIHLANCLIIYLLSVVVNQRANNLIITYVVREICEP